MRHPGGWLYTYRGSVVDVYDGDTITVMVDLGFHTYRLEKLRIADIDAPEVRGLERPEGLESRDYLRDLILGKEVDIQTIKDKKGKYGRYIAVVTTQDGRDVASEMCKAGMATWWG